MTIEDLADKMEKLGVELDENFRVVRINGLCKARDFQTKWLRM